VTTVKYAAGTPSQWVITLKSGNTIELLADRFSQVDDEVRFSVLAEATNEEQAAVCVLGRTPSQPERVDILVAKIPQAEVAQIEGGWPWPAVQQQSTATEPASSGP